jgi:cytochrome c
MKIMSLAAILALSVSTHASAMGDAEAGEKGFKKCKSCHMIANGDDVIVKGGKTGPNLYGVIGRTAGTQEDFSRYGKSLVAAGEAGLIWDDETFLVYVQDPGAFLKDYLDDSSAKSKMTLNLKKGGEDVLAYLKSVAAE